MESHADSSVEIFDISPVIVPGFFAPADCKQLISYFQEGKKESGKLRPVVRGAEESPSSYLVRNNTVCWLDELESNAWVYGKIRGLIVEINQKIFKFQIDKLQPIQLAEYKASGTGEGEYYRPHLDICTRGWNTQRKLSLSLQLSSPEDYEGGDLCLFGDKNDQLMDQANLEHNLQQRRQLGTAIIFPSFYEHEVKPVTKGTRYSLVAWMEGPNWK